MLKARSERTVFAEATPAARAAVRIIRITGPDVREILQKLTRKALFAEESRERIKPRTAKVLPLYEPVSGDLLDRALILYFQAPKSYTGEESAELQLHGGQAVIEGVCEALLQTGAVLAEPGEFTERAFFNGKLELTEAEAIADLINAETAAQKKQALRQLDGELGRLYRSFSERLADLIAHQEALIDFSDEELPIDDPVHGILPALAGLQEEIEQHLADGHRGERLRKGITVVLAGPVNAGKSTLMNELAGREVAIVSPIAGTTRDRLEIRTEIAGVPVVLMDTAGLRETADEIEKIGIERAGIGIREADLAVFLADFSAADAEKLLVEAKLPALPPGVSSFRVVTKADLLSAEALKNALEKFAPDFILSVKNKTGLAEFKQALTEEIQKMTAAGNSPHLTRARHRLLLQEAVAEIKEARRALQDELRAENMRLALQALGELTGRIGHEEILDRIFREFCLGK